MENKDSKLVTLVESCVDNKKFYYKNHEENYQDRYLPKKQIEAKESINCSEHNLQKHLHDVIKRDCFLENDSSNHWRQFDRNGFYETVKKLDFQKYHKSIELYSGFDIYFIDYPPITIKINSTVERKNVFEFFVDETKSHYQRENKLKFWKEKKFVLIPTGYKMKYNVVESTFDKFYTIECGSIKENISIDRFNVLFEKYKLNLARFTKEIDEEKIQERLDKYKI